MADDRKNPRIPSPWADKRRRDPPPAPEPKKTPPHRRVYGKITLATKVTFLDDEKPEKPETPVS